MNTRDKIAIAAMNGLMTKETWDLQEFEQDPMRIAMWSYDIADAMIIEKKRRELEEKNKHLVTLPTEKENVVFDILHIIANTSNYEPEAIKIFDAVAKAHYKSPVAYESCVEKR